jgi:hypothetical protein
MSDWTCYCPQCSGTLEPPEPCEYCWISTGVMKVCDGSCDGLTEKAYRKHYGDYRQEGKPLIHKGGKP